MRYIAIDLGDRRTGVAIGDAVTRIVSPLDVTELPLSLQDGKPLIEALARIADDHLGTTPTSGDLVIGLPLNMDGSEGSRAKLVRAFAARLTARTRRTVHFQDERLSTAAADSLMARSGLTHGQKKARRDALAAATILSDFLAAHHPPPTPTDTDAEP